MVTLAAIHVCFHVKQMNDIDASIQQYEWETRSPVLTIPWPEPPCSKRQEPRVYVLWSYESYVIPVQPIHTISYLRFISNQSNRSLKFPCGVGMPCAARHPVARWGLSSSIATPHCFRQLRWAVSSSDTRVTSGPYIGCSRFKRVPSVFKPFIACFFAFNTPRVWGGVSSCIFQACLWMDSFSQVGTTWLTSQVPCVKICTSWAAMEWRRSLSQLIAFAEACWMDLYKSL